MVFKGPKNRVRSGSSQIHEWSAGRSINLASPTVLSDFMLNLLFFVLECQWIQRWMLEYDVGVDYYRINTLNTDRLNFIWYLLSQILIGSPLAKPVLIRTFLSCLWVTRESLVFIKLLVVGKVIIFSFIIISNKK